MLRISRLTDYATVILASLAGGGLASAADIAERTHIGVPTVSKLLKELQQEMNLSYLFISHDLRVVRHIADEVAVMHRGKLIEHDTVEALYAAPKQEYTRNLLNAIPGRQRLAVQTA